MTPPSFTMPRDANYSDEQHQLAEVSRDAFAALNPPGRVRELWDQPSPRDRKVWKHLAEMGLTGIGVSEEHGGMGGDANDLVQVLEHAGATLLPEPLRVTVGVAVPTLVEVGGEVAAEWLPRLAGGQATATVAFAGAPFVLDVDDADLVLHERDGALWLSGPVADGDRVRSEDGSRRLFRRPELHGVMIGDAGVLARAQVRATASTAAELVGVCTALVDQCVDYARIRQQFGTSIGAFQSIQHLLADMFVSVESARGAARHAARRVAADADDAGHAASVAKAAAAKAHRRVNTDALQLFAGIGFTWEHDLHLWLKRGLALELQDGDERHHRRIIAAHLFDS